MPSWQHWSSRARDAADRILADANHTPEQREEVLRACALECLGGEVCAGGWGHGRMSISPDVLGPDRTVVMVVAHEAANYPTPWWDFVRKDNTNRGYDYQIGRTVLQERLDLGAEVEAWVRTFEPLPPSVTESYPGFHVTYATRRDYSTFGRVLVLPPDFDPASQRAWLVGRVGHVLNHPTSGQVPVAIVGSPDVETVDVRRLRLLVSVTRYL